MKKRILTFLLALLMLVPECGFAAVKGYLNQQMATRSGPGTKYTEELCTLPSSTEIQVIAQAETNGTVWYQVEFTRNQKLYRCYTGKKRVDAFGDIPWESPDYVEDTVIAGADAYYGPGAKYAKRKNGVYKNSTVRVFGVEGEWALCEYKDGSKWCRAYLNVEKLKNTVAAAITPTPVPTAVPTATPAPTPRLASNVIDRANCLCIDYYGNLYDYSGHSEDFAGLDPQADIPQFFHAHAVPHMQVLHHQLGLAVGKGLALEGLELGGLAHHQLRQLLGVSLLFAQRTLGFAAAEYGDVICHGHDLFELVSDENDGLILTGHPAQHHEQLLALQRRKHGGGLVQNQDLRAAAQGLQDLYTLQKTHRQVFDPGLRVDL